MTVMLGGKQFLKNKRFSFLVYELHERKFYARNIEYAAKNAEYVIVPEYCRAHIMQSRYGLKKVPFVLPNKSDIEFDSLILSESGEKSVKTIKELKASGNKVLVYMGGVGTERPLGPLLKSLRAIKGTKLAVIGRYSEYLGTLIKEYGDVLVYLNSFFPPEHLAVAQYCDIGVLNYVSINQKQGLNALFCAPNKIYEYTGLGLPIIANDIPGLKFEIQSGNCGKLVDYSDINSIKEALTSIFADYDNYSASAKKYYASLDIDKILNDILNSFK